jgi:hypothetical protein
MANTLNLVTGNGQQKLAQHLHITMRTETSNHYLLTLQEAQVEQGLIKMV